MKTLLVLGTCAAVALAIMPFRVGNAPLDKPLTAPTYYIAAFADTCEPDSIAFRGASNLPPGAIISVVVADFYDDSWKIYSDEAYFAVSDKGFFKGRIGPKKGLKFRHNLVLNAVFATDRPRQTPAVLAIVGKKGENLAGLENAPPHDLIGLSPNPQLYQASGWYYGLATIARASCGEGLHDSPEQK